MDFVYVQGERNNWKETSGRLFRKPSGEGHCDPGEGSSVGLTLDMLHRVKTWRRRTVLLNILTGWNVCLCICLCLCGDYFHILLSLETFLFFSLLRFFKNFIYHCWFYKVLTQISPRVNSPHACNSQIHDFYFNFCIVLHTSQINDFCFNFFIFIYMSISCSVHLTLLSHVVFSWPLGMGNLSEGSSLKINSPSLSNYYFLQILN